MTCPLALRLGAVLAAAGLAACAIPLSTPQHRADQAAVAACRAHADEVYAKQNRAEVYRADTYATSSRDAPFATSGLPGITSAGLSGEYARDEMVSDCLNGTGATTRPAAASTPATSAGPSPSAPAPPPSTGP